VASLLMVRLGSGHRGRSGRTRSRAGAARDVGHIVWDEAGSKKANGKNLIPFLAISDTSSAQVG
jgi:hypothetical protein